MIHVISSLNTSTKTILAVIGILFIGAAIIGIRINLPLVPLSPRSPLLTSEDRYPSKLISPKANIPPLTVEKAFSNEHTWTATLSADLLRTLIVTGDIIPARSVNVGAIQRGNFHWTFEKTAHILKDADTTLVNFETPLISNCPATNEGMIFCGDTRHIEGLLFAGVDIANLANNHTGNYGEEGITSTKDLLEQNGISVSGIRDATYRTIRGIRFAFLGYNDIDIPQDFVSHTKNRDMEGEIREARALSDIVIVSFHWGEEYRDMPTTRQQELARQAVDAGADLIIGNHPHWIQPIEFYHSKLVTYAHGNFIFDQEWSQKTKEGVVGRYIFYNTELIDVEFLPVFIKDYGQAQFMEGAEKQRVLGEMKTNSLRLSNESLY